MTYNCEAELDRKYHAVVLQNLRLLAENAELKRQLAEREGISVEDRLPDNDDSVLVFYLGAHGWYSIITARFSNQEWRFLHKKHKNRLPERITHWMPLPAAPNQKETEK